jgi:hypothetical protein
MERFFCAVASRDRGDAVFGTASRVDRFLLVESPGPWGPRALPQSRGLDEAVVLALQQRAKASHARLLLIRRPGRPGPLGSVGAGRSVYAAECRPGQQRLVRRVVADDTELEALQPPFGDADLSEWSPATALVGVCTQGAHDVCCAMLGRPVAAALAVSHPEITWEVSHIGGDRFAANLLVLPGGHYLGRVPPSEAAAVIDAVLAGRRPSPYYRGRAAWLTPVQAAQELAAGRLGVTALDGLTPRRIQQLQPHRWRVTMDGPDGGIVSAEVEQRHSETKSLLTCHALHEHGVPSWHLLSLEPE